MSATTQRDNVCNLAKLDPSEALTKARAISDPWFRAQALSWVARFTDSDPTPIALEATHAAASCDDNYKRSAVRAWEIAALAERELVSQARQALTEAIALAERANPPSSRSESFTLLMAAAFRLGEDDAMETYQRLIRSCAENDHWRCKRAIRDGKKMLTGALQPRTFFW